MWEATYFFKTLWICLHYKTHLSSLSLPPYHRFVFLTWAIICSTVSEHHFCSPMSEQWKWQGASCLLVCLPVLCSLLLPPPSVITSSTAHRLTIRWGQGHKRSTTSSHHCGILNSLRVRAAGQREAFCTSEVPQPAGQSASWDYKC